jgi:hypothetical protein
MSKTKGILPTLLRIPFLDDFAIDLLAWSLVVASKAPFHEFLNGSSVIKVAISITGETNTDFPAISP